MNLSVQTADPALAVMTMDILNNVLARADKPSELGQYLTEALRGLVGGKAVLLLSRLSCVSCAEGVVAVSPERRLPDINLRAVDALCAMHGAAQAAVIIHADAKGGAAEKLVAATGLGTCLLLPLRIGDILAGFLVIIDLADVTDAERNGMALEPLSAIIALALRNATAFSVQEERLRIATRAANIGIWDWDIARNELAWDDSMYRLHGIKGEDFGGAYEGWAGVLHPDDRAYAEGEIEAALRGEREYAPEFRILWPDGTVRYLEADSRTFRGPDGKPVRMIGTNIDITERKQAEEALRKARDELERRVAEAELNEARLEAVLQLSHMTEASLKEITDFALERAVALTKSKIGYLAFMNEDETVLTMHSWSKQAMAECAISDKPLVYPLEKTGLWGEAARQRKPIVTNDYAAPNPLIKGIPEGHVKLKRHMNAPIFDGGRIVIVAGVGNKDEDYEESDIRQLVLLMQGMWTLIQRRRVQTELQEHRDHLEQLVLDRTAQLEAANKELEAFSYSVSHDLRAPLRAIDGYGRMLAEDYKSGLDSEGRRLLDVISYQTKRMGQLIDDLLSFSRLGRRKLEPSDIDMTALVQALFEELAAQVPQRILRLEMTSLLPAQGDPAMMRMALGNLLSNAIKYTRDRNPAIIEIGSRLEDEQNVYYVKDNGAGFDMKYANKLFMVFQRLHSTEEFEGTGIGLALVQRIINRHGGRVWAEAKVNEGATFYFSLPNMKGKEP